MGRDSIKEVLMRRDGLSDFEAETRVIEAQDRLLEYLADGREDLAYNICEEMFGLEPDYLDELLPY